MSKRLNATIRNSLLVSAWLVIGGATVFAQGAAPAPATPTPAAPTPAPVTPAPATSAPATSAPATLAPTTLDSLTQAGPLGDLWVGDPNAPVTIIEYASLTCSHCAHFNETGFPVLKSKYIDTGKVKYVFRDFPLDPLAVGAHMLSHCAGDKKLYPLVDMLFKQQSNWAFVQRPLDALAATVKQAGFTQESFETCLKDQKMYDAVVAVRDRAEKLGVDSTPTFFINGKKTSGAMSPKELDDAIEPLLKK